jgi:hypothetical protein
VQARELPIVPPASGNVLLPCLFKKRIEVADAARCLVLHVSCIGGAVSRAS